MDKAYTFSDVLIVPKYSNITTRKKTIESNQIDTSVQLAPNIRLELPIIAANMKTICGPKMAITMAKFGGMGILHRFNTIEQAISDYNEVANAMELYPEDIFLPRKKYHVGVSVGVQETDKERVYKLYEAGARIFCIDVAHGHHILVKDMLHWLHSQTFDDITIIAGNIATGHAAVDLSEWGADIVKVGIGPGSVCTTRSQTGVGVPQLFALETVFNTIQMEKLNTTIIADGGIVETGDIPKALKYGTAVMIGSLFAGTSETPGIAYPDPLRPRQYYKMYGGSASGENKASNSFAEGLMKTVPFRGKVKYILREMQDGIRSACAYINAHNMKEFQEECDFIEISEGAKRESKY